MTEATVALIEYLHNMGLDKDVDLLREIVRVVSQALMELEVADGGRGGAVAHFEVAERDLLSQPAGTETPCGEGIAGGGAAPCRDGTSLH